MQDWKMSDQNVGYFSKFHTSKTLAAIAKSLKRALHTNRKDILNIFCCIDRL